MKRSKEYLILAVALSAALFVSNVNAQEKSERKVPRGDRPGAERMMDELGLNAEQAAKVKAIQDAERAQREALRADASLSREQKMEKGKALRDATVQQVDAVLTPEQRAKAQAMRAKAHERMKERRGPKGGEGHDGPPPKKN
jgi:Spy/CpxP family protein refolding chaperone